MAFDPDAQEMAGAALGGKAVDGVARGASVLAVPAAWGSATALLKWKKAVSRMRSPEGYRPMVVMAIDSKGK